MEGVLDVRQLFFMVWSRRNETKRACAPLEKENALPHFIEVLVPAVLGENLTVLTLAQPPAIDVSSSRQWPGNGRAAPPCTPVVPNLHPHPHPPWTQPTSATLTRSGCCCRCRRVLLAVERGLWGRRTPAEQPGSWKGDRCWRVGDVWGELGGRGADWNPRAPSPPGTTGGSRLTPPWLGFCN